MGCDNKQCASDDFAPIGETNNVPAVVSTGLVFDCDYVKQSFELSTCKVSFSAHPFGIFADFFCICGRNHTVKLS